MQMSLCLHFHNYVDISQLAFQGRPVPNLSLIHLAHGLPLPSMGTVLGTGGPWGRQAWPPLACSPGFAASAVPAAPVLVPEWPHRLSTASRTA